MRFHRCYKILVKHLRQTANSYHHPSLVAKVQHMLLQFLNSQNWNQKFSKTCDISQLPSNAVILFTKYQGALKHTQLWEVFLSLSCTIKRTNFSNKYSSNDNLSPLEMCLFFWEKRNEEKQKSVSGKFWYVFHCGEKRKIGRIFHRRRARC